MKTSKSLLGILVCALVFGASLAACGGGAGNPTGGGGVQLPANLKETKWTWVSGGEGWESSSFIVFYYSTRSDPDGEATLYRKNHDNGRGVTVSGRAAIRNIVENGEIRTFASGVICGSYAISGTTITFTGGGSANGFDGSKWEKTTFENPDDEN